MQILKASLILPGYFSDWKMRRKVVGVLQKLFCFNSHLNSSTNILILQSKNPNLQKGN